MKADTRRRELSNLMAAGMTLAVVSSVVVWGGEPPQDAASPGGYDDYTGFTKLWDGTTLTNWNGETDVWSVDSGAIHADTTKTLGQHHIHYTGPGAIMRDFDLRVEMKISAAGANGGIQYRSRLLHPAHGGTVDDPLGRPLPPSVTTFAEAIAAGLAAAPAPRGGQSAPNAGNPWQVSGYQFDVDSVNRGTGQLYEVGGRGNLARPGAIMELLAGGTSVQFGTVADTPASFVKPNLGLDGEWNQIEIITRGNTLVHILNGHVMTATIDNDPAARVAQGIMSLQLESSGQIWYRNIYVRPVDLPQ